jgi:hypothetical protein
VAPSPPSQASPPWTLQRPKQAISQHPANHGRRSRCRHSSRGLTFPPQFVQCQNVGGGPPYSGSPGLILRGFARDRRAPPKLIARVKNEKVGINDAHASYARRQFSSTWSALTPPCPSCRMRNGFPNRRLVQCPAEEHGTACVFRQRRLNVG